jgi:ATP-dependent protease HslVU (ClpYQ) peptidase subunit
MTCVVGLISEDRVYIGADSASVDVSDLVTRPTNVPKVFKRGKFLIGYTTSFRMGQLLEHWLDVPSRPDGQKGQVYMVKEFVERVRELFKDKGFATVKNSNEKGGTFLVGYNGCLYTIHGDFQVAELSDGFDAVGCGSEFALGAMAALTDLKPAQRIKKSLEIAAYFSAGVCPPFRIKSMKV